MKRGNVTIELTESCCVGKTTASRVGEKERRHEDSLEVLARFPWQEQEPLEVTITKTISGFGAY